MVSVFQLANSRAVGKQEVRAEQRVVQEGSSPSGAYQLPARQPTVLILRKFLPTNLPTGN